MTDGADGPEPLAAPAPRLSDAPILVVTRFAFLGASGWQSESSRNAEMLFDPDRLRLRLELFRRIAMPSLAAQTDQDFRHVVLTSTQLPAWAKAELGEACAAAHGNPDRFAIVAGRPGPTRKLLRLYLEKTYPDPVVAQMILDDDDGLARDFVATVRDQLAAMDATGQPAAPDGPAYVSFSDGYGLVLDLTDDGETAARLYRHRYPFINCGLTLVGRPSGKNVLGISHQKDPRVVGAVSITGPRMFVRSVHGSNDSRVAPTGRWHLMDNWRDDPDIRARFAWLLDDGAFWNVC